MGNNKKHSRFLMMISIAIFLLVLSACGGFGGHYKIESSRINGISTDAKIPVNVLLVLNPDLCNYTYTSTRQGAKRVFELGDALCTNNRNVFTSSFKKVMVVSNEHEGKAFDFDATAIPKVVDTSILVRPGLPPNMEATIIFECSIVDKKNRTIFLRTIKENKIYQGYGYESYRIAMQQAMDELFIQLRNELTSSPEIKKFAKPSE